MTRSYLIHLLSRLLPRPVWNVLMRAMGKPELPPPLTFGHMRTSIGAPALVSGQFAEICERVQKLDPHIPPAAMRYRIYNVAMLARSCLSVPGDIAFLGVSYGITARVTYELANIAATDKTIHLVDPFEGAGGVPGYNTDPDYVRRQYPEDARIVMHRRYIPDALPLPGVERLCFTSANTGVPDAEARSIPMLFDRLSAGGIMMFDRYGIEPDLYDAAFAKIGADPIWLPSGQCFVIKR